MRKVRIPVANISGGEYTAAPPLSMRPQYSRLLQNFYINSEGHIKKIPGYSPISQKITNVKITTGIDFKKSDGTSIILLGGITSTGVNANTVKFTNAPTGLIPAPIFSGTGVNDITSTGTFTGAESMIFTIECIQQGTGFTPPDLWSGDVYRWKKNSGTWNYVFGDLTQPQTVMMSDGVGFITQSGAGHTVGDNWTIDIGYYSTPLDDMVPSGVCSQAGGAFFEVLIDSTGATDTFKWRKDGGAWTTGVAITGSAQLLSDSVSVTFAATTGHSYGSKWEITCSPIRGCVYRLDNGILSVLKGDFLSTALIYFTQIGDRVIISNGHDRPVIYDGTNISNVNLPFKNTVEFTGTGINDMSAVISYVLAEQSYNIEIDSVAQTPVVTFTGTGINDLSVPSPNYSGAATANFDIEIDGAGTQDTFKYNINGGLSIGGIEVSDSVSTANIAGSIYLEATSRFGHNINDVYQVLVTEATTTSAKIKYRKNDGAWSEEKSLTTHPTNTGLGGEWRIAVDNFSALNTDDIIEFQCDGATSADTFKWRKDSEDWTTGVAITGSAQELKEGISIQFNYLTGHNGGTGVGWSFGVSRDTVKYRIGTGAYTTGVNITGANQEITPGINFKFASINGHTLGDKWYIPIEQGVRLGKGYTYKNRSWHISNEDMLVFHSALDNPTDFYSADDAGYLDFKYVLPNGDEIKDISSVLSTIVFFFKNHIAIYSGSDPTENGDFALYQLVEGIGVVAADCVVRVGNDIYFLSSYGVKSLKQIINLGALNIDSVSTAIDKDIMSAIAANTSNIYGSAHYAKLGIIIFLIGNTLFIYNYNKQAWSRVVIPGQINDNKILGMFTTSNGRLFFGGYDYLLEFNPETMTYNFNSVAPVYKWHTAYLRVSDSNLFFTDMVTRLATFNETTFLLKVKTIGTDINTEDQTSFNEQQIVAPATGEVNDEVMNHILTPLFGAGKYVQICYTESPSTNTNNDVEFSGLEIRGEVSEGQ